MVNELSYALRKLVRTPISTGAAVVSLALGIGAFTAVFSIASALLLKSLPVPQPEGLVFLQAHGIFGDTRTISYPLYMELRDHLSSFSGLAGRASRAMNLATGNRTERVSGELVSGNYYKVLGIRPYMGRLFGNSDDHFPQGEAVAVLSYRYWSEYFGA